MMAPSTLQRSPYITFTLSLLFVLVTNISATTASPSIAPSSLPTSFPSLAPVSSNLLPASDPLKVNTITMTLTGLNPLTPAELKWFEKKTEGYIIYYYNVEVSSCNTCLQKDFDIAEVLIEVSEQDPPYTDQSGTTNNRNERMRQRRLNQQQQQHKYPNQPSRKEENNHVQRNLNLVDVNIEINEDGKSSSSNLMTASNTHTEHYDKTHRTLQQNKVKVTLTYSQTISYQKISNNIEDPKLDDIVKEPFNNISKRRRYMEFIKAPANVPDAFKSLNIVSAPTIKEEKKSIFGIGVIATIVAGGLIVLVVSVFFICRCTGQRTIGGSSSGAAGVYGSGYDDAAMGKYDQEENPMSAKSRRSNGHHNLAQPQHPSQVHLPELKDEVSTMVDPSPQYGYFNGGKSLADYNTPSVASFDPDYVGLYNGGAEDPSIISSADGTMGSHTQKSKFSAMESILTPAGLNGVGAGGGQSVYTEDEQSFENHLRNQRKIINGKPQREEYFDIYAPGGKLGVVIDTPNNGAPVVHNIKETCPIKDQLKVGDKLIAVDDEDVRSMTAVKVSKLISQKSNNPTRKFTIARLIDE